MEAHERIRTLRKNLLKMNLEEFAEKINMSRSNLGNIETGVTGLTSRVIGDISRTFCVYEEWLLHGQEPVFFDGNEPFPQKFVAIYSILNENSKKCLRGYIDRLLEEQGYQDYEL